jgi:hypothetical protein
MPVYETYAARAATAAKAGAPDVYVYDKLPPFLKKQISQILTESIPAVDEYWTDVAKTMDREIESFSTLYGPGSGSCLTYLAKSEDLEGVLSLIEICAGAMARAEIDELNARFLQHGVGYQFENGQIIRIDSQYVHAEVVKEALWLLRQPGFETANDEFMKAHRHLREGNLRDANTAALRAMETVLKVICDAREWTYQRGDTVEKLLAVVQREGLFPDYLGGYFTNLIGAMKAGVPKIRDRQGGHGAAPGDDPVPDHVAAFALHLTAANIVMLVKAHRAK